MHDDRLDAGSEADLSGAAPVLQMTRNGIVHLAFHPSSSALVIAAADKSGHVGLWSVDECLSGRPSASASKENRAASPARGEGDDVKGVTTGKPVAPHQGAACCSNLARRCDAAECSCQWPLQAVVRCPWGIDAEPA